MNIVTKQDTLSEAGIGYWVWLLSNMNIVTKQDT